MFKMINDLPDPNEFKKEIPLPDNLKEIKNQRDNELKDIFLGKVNKFVLIVGPCSADNPDAIFDYVSRLAKIQEKVKKEIFIIPRVYTNKPRTTGMGYKGMLHQPNPNKAPDLKKGIKEIRKMHIKVISESHLSAADEMLYPENYLFLDDLLSYHAIGARSVENQQHRLTASGVEVPVGMKNPTSGDLTVMFNSIVAAQSHHNFIYRQQEVETDGNLFAHGIMRGSVNKHGDNIPNYHYEDLVLAHKMYMDYNLKNPVIIIDTNHANSGKKFKEQIRITKEILNSRKYNKDLKDMIKGLMIESYIEEGSQSIEEGVYGKSITDSCLNIEDTENLIYEIAEKA